MDDVLISKCRNCINCPYRLYQKSNTTIKQGRGNYYGKAIRLNVLQSTCKVWN